MKMRHPIMRCGIALFLSMLLCSGFVYAQAVQPISSPFTVLSNNANATNDSLFVEIMYDKANACGDYKAQFRLATRLNPAGDTIAVAAFLNNPGTFETDADMLSLMRPTAGGYRLRFALPNVENPADSGYHICVDAYTMPYKCVGCAAGGSDAIFADADIDPACPYTGSDLLACYRRQSREGNWEAWIQDPRDCQPYRVVAMPDGRWWFAQNLNFQKDLTMYAASSDGPSAAPATADGGFWCPGGKSFTQAGVAEFANSTTAGGGAAACKTYGALYTWTTARSLNGRGAASPQGVCPEGWQLPGSNDWGALLNAAEGCPSPLTADGTKPCNHLRSDLTTVGFLGSNNVKAVLKNTVSCPPHATANDTVCARDNRAAWTWHRADYKGKIATPLALGSDRYGFTLLPAGLRSEGKAFNNAGTGAAFWSADASGSSGLARRFTNDDNTVALSLSRKDMGMSVRCVSAESAVGGFFIYPAGSAGIAMAADAASLSLSCQNLGVGWTYSWTANGAAIAGNTPSVILNNSGYAVGSTVTILVTATKAGDLNSPQTASKTVNVVATPPIELPSLGLTAPYAAPSVVSRNAAINLSVYSTVQPAGATYTWTVTPLTAGAPAWNLTGATNTVSTTAPAVNAESRYTISVTMRASGYQTATTSVEITVLGCNALVQGAITPGNQTVCPGAALSALTSTLSGGNAADYRYQWQQRVGSGVWTNIASATSASYTPTAPNTTSAVVSYRRVVTSCGQTSESLPITVNTHPKITQPTLAQQNACAGATATISLAAASGGGASEPTYQWLVSTDNVTFSTLAGQINRAASVTANATANAYNYYRRIATGNTCNNIKDTSVFVALRSTALGNYSQTVTARTINACPNTNLGNIAFPTVNNVNGTPTAYAWQQQIFPAAGFSNIASATAATYSATLTSNAIAGATNYYRRNATICGNTSSSPNAVTVISNGDMTTQTVMANFTTCPNVVKRLTATAITTAPANAGTTTYKWQISIDGIAWTDLNAFTTNIYYDWTPTTAGTFLVRRVAQRCTTPVVHIGNPTTVIVREGLTQGTISNTQACPGANVTFTLAAATGGTNITYQWEQFDAAANAWVDMSGEVNQNLTVAAPAVSGESSPLYRRRATSTDCGSSTTGSAKVEALPASVTVGQNLKEMYETSPNMPVVLAPTITGVGTITYQWYSSSDNEIFSPIAGATNPTYEVKLTAEGQFSPYYRLTATIACGDVSSTSNVTRVSVPLGCPYKGADLVEGSCVRRTIGAQNWEAVVKDSRDNRTYRIVQMPGGDWWFAQNLAHKEGVEGLDWIYNFTDDPGTYEQSGLLYHFAHQPCPGGWRAPVENDWEKMLNCATGNCLATTYKFNWVTLGNGADLHGTGDAVFVRKFRAAENWGTHTGAGVGTDDWGFSLKHGPRGDGSVDTYRPWRASITHPRTIVFQVESATVGRIRQYYTGIPQELKTCCGGGGAPVRCIFDSTMTASKAPEKIEATYITVTNGGSTTLTAKGAALAGGASYQWGMGAVNDANAISGTSSAVLADRVLTANTTFWVRIKNADGSYTSAASIDIKVAACPYPATQGDLVRITECRQRGTGAQNWEAYMQDSRATDANSTKEYRIVYMPDGKWWFAQNLNFQRGLTYRATWNTPNTGTDTTNVKALKGSFWCSTNTYIGDADGDHPSGGQEACKAWGALYPWATVVSTDGINTTLNMSTAPVTPTISNNNDPSNVRGVCPPSWHAPSRLEWDKMLQCVDGDCNSGLYEASRNTWTGTAGRKLKSTKVHTNTPSLTNTAWLINAEYISTDDYGFSVIPAGWRREIGYGRMGIYGFMMSITSRRAMEENLARTDAGFTWKQFINSSERVYNQYAQNMLYAGSVRCVTNANAAATETTAPTEVYADYTGVSSGTQITLTAKGATLGTGASYQWGTGSVVGVNDMASPTTETYTLTPTSTKDTTLWYWVRVKRADATYTEGVTVPIFVQSTTECPYKGGDLVAGTCLLRGDKAKNWTAKITDARDGRVYSIVLMPDGKWWLAENLKYTTNLNEATTVNLPTTATGKNAAFKSYYWCPPLETVTNTNITTVGGGAAGCEKYGVLYPWYTFMSTDGVGETYFGADNEPEDWRGVCPAGWYVGSSRSWRNMLNCVEGNCSNEVFPVNEGGQAWLGLRAGHHLRIENQFPTTATFTHWNSYGFGIEAPGYRHENAAQFSDVRYAAMMLTSGVGGTNSQAAVWIHYQYSGAYTPTGTYGYNYARGGSLRCVWSGEAVEQPETTAPTNLAADANPISSGTSVKLTATGGTMRSGASYEWATNAGFSPVLAETGSSITVSPTANTTYYVRRVDNGTPTAALNLELKVTPCPYTVAAGETLIECKTRSEGKKNWMAKIRVADGNEYEVVNVGNMWVFAQDLRATTGTGANTRAQYGSDPTRFTYTPAAVLTTRSAVGAATGAQSICPTGWTLPSSNQIINLANCASGQCGTAKWAYDRFTHFSLYVNGCQYARSNVDPIDFESFSACNNAWGANFWGSWNGSWHHIMTMVDGPLTNGRVWHWGGYNESMWMRRIDWFPTNAVYSWAGTACYVYEPTTGEGNCQYAPIRCVRATTCTDNITAQSTPANATLSPGQSQSFTATVTGGATYGGVTYQWEVSYDNGTSYIAIQGATAESYTYTAPTSDAPNVKLRRLAMSACGNTHVGTANTVTITRAGTCPYTPLAGEEMQNCVRRGTGAQNWEASIKDVRDNQRYAIIRTANGTWITAQPMAFDYNTAATNESALYPAAGTLGRVYNNTLVMSTANMCPPGWKLPRYFDMDQMFPYSLPTPADFQNHWGFLNPITNTNYPPNYNYTTNAVSGNNNTHMLFEQACAGNRPSMGYTWGTATYNSYRGGKFTSNSGCAYTWSGTRYHCIREK